MADTPLQYGDQVWDSACRVAVPIFKTSWTRGCAPVTGVSHSSVSVGNSTLGCWRGGFSRLLSLRFRNSGEVLVLTVEQSGACRRQPVSLHIQTGGEDPEVQPRTGSVSDSWSNQEYFSALLLCLRRPPWSMTFSTRWKGSQLSVTQLG